MKYIILLFSIALSSSVFGQSESTDRALRNEISTDISGAFADQYRLDFNHLYKDNLAFAFGVRTRSESVGVTMDTASATPHPQRIEYVDRGIQYIDLRAGVRWYLGNWQPVRGFWFQPSALVSLADWQSQDYKDARQKSIYPKEYRDPQTMFGLEAALGYRYVFKYGISLNAHLTMSGFIDRSTFVTDRLSDRQRTSGGFDFRLAGSFLTLGYAW